MPGRGPLDGIRVVDVTTLRGQLAGRVLADLGAEVLAVEPPGGSPTRRLPPFEAGREHDRDGSLYWATVALGKRSLELDLWSREGGEQLRALAAGADVFLESFDPGVLDAAGLGYAALAERNPALIYASITPFGQTGPHAHTPATDLTLEAAGGLVNLQGDGDRPPIPVGFPQASFHGAVQAAADVTIALNERQRSGLGQHLDVSLQSAVVWTLMNATGYPPVTGHNPPGTSEFRADPRPQIVPGLTVPLVVECSDGWAFVGMGLPVVGERATHHLMHWAEAAGALPEDLRGITWTRWISDVVDGRRQVRDMARAFEALQAFLRTRPKSELMRFAVENSVLLAPAYDASDLRADPQLAARDYWTDVGGRTHPGRFARLSETPLVLERPAPALGEGQALLDAPRSVDVRPAGSERDTAEGVFSGLKVADFAWVGVGPIMSKALADHGATVVHVESESRLDVLRQLPPFKDDQPGIGRSQFHANFNTSKLGLALALDTDAGRELAGRLVDWADVVVESFSPGTMRKLGLDWESLSRERDDLIMLSTCMRGQTGPERGYSGFGNQGAALAGLVSITGWPDRTPVGPWGAYTDFIAPRFGLSALASALYHRARTGRGQYIDQSQIESGMHFMEPLLLDYTVNGRVAGAVGHASPYACPHGVYRVRGVERYIALAVETADQWRALCGVAPLDTFDADALAGLDARLAKRDELDAALRAWCADRDAYALAGELQAAGVPAYVVQRPDDLYRDPQLAHRGFFVTLDHSEIGPTPYDGLVTHFSRTPGRLRRPGPLLGEHTEPVLRDILGLSDDEITQYAIAGALT